MHEVRVRPAEGVEHRAGAVDGEAHEVDHRVGAQCGDAAPEGPVAVLLFAVGGDPFDPLPLRGVDVGRTGAAGDDHDVVAGPDETRDEEGADGRWPDDDDAHDGHARPPALRSGMFRRGTDLLPAWLHDPVVWACAPSAGRSCSPSCSRPRWSPSTRRSSPPRRRRSLGTSDTSSSSRGCSRCTCSPRRCRCRSTGDSRTCSAGSVCSSSASGSSCSDRCCAVPPGRCRRSSRAGSCRVSAPVPCCRSR